MEIIWDFCKNIIHFALNYSFLLFIGWNSSALLALLLAVPFFIKHLPRYMDVMSGMDVRYDCYVEKDALEKGFEGRYRDMPQRAAPPSDRGEKGGQLPVFIEKLEDKTVSVGGLVRFIVKVEASPTADVTFYKDGKEIKGSGDYLNFCCF